MKSVFKFFPDFHFGVGVMIEAKEVNTSVLNQEVEILLVRPLLLLCLTTDDDRAKNNISQYFFCLIRKGQDVRRSIF